MTLEEKALAYRVIEEDLNHLSSELLKNHPEGRVPLLIDEDRVLFESSVITEYLDETFPEIPLMPKTPWGKASVRLWTVWCNQVFKPDLDLFKYELKNLDQPAAAALSLRIGAHLAKLERELERKPFLMGETLTLADIHLFPFYRQLQKVRPEPNEMLDSWLEKITARPSFLKVMKK
jgi:glutathione S-transferase